MLRLFLVLGLEGWDVFGSLVMGAFCVSVVLYLKKRLHVDVFLHLLFQCSPQLKILS